MCGIHFKMQLAWEKKRLGLSLAEVFELTDCFRQVFVSPASFGEQSGRCIGVQKYQSLVRPLWQCDADSAEIRPCGDFGIFLGLTDCFRVSEFEALGTQSTLRESLKCFEALYGNLTAPAQTNVAVACASER